MYKTANYCPEYNTFYAFSRAPACKRKSGAPKTAQVANQVAAFISQVWGGPSAQEVGFTGPGAAVEKQYRNQELLNLNTVFLTIER